jgi:multidrug efflux pump subunit AcrA (membrane-fusion protein)
VPDSAVTEIDGRPTVFIAGTDGHSFTPRSVTLGREVAGRQAVASGLSPGDRVVSSGTFVLKSELILQGEEGED